jgi:hypothetical protein
MISLGAGRGFCQKLEMQISCFVNKPLDVALWCLKSMLLDQGIELGGVYALTGSCCIN